MKHYKTPACKSCPVRSECTTNPNGRIIDRSENAEAVEADNRRLLSQKELYQQRQQLCEHPFGTIKRQWGYDHILLKGLKKNNGDRDASRWNHRPVVQFCPRLKHFRLQRAKKAPGEVFFDCFEPVALYGG